MDNWAFFTGMSGNELTRGWQGDRSAARALAKQWANKLGEAVEFVRESEISDPDAATVVEPD